MYRIILSILTILLLIPQFAIAAPAINDGTPKPAPALQLPTLPADMGSGKTPKAAKPEITNIRYAVHTDAANGDVKLRLVIDATGPVQSEAVLKDAPLPQIEVSVKGASLGIRGTSQPLDGKIANKITFVQASGDSKMIIDLENMIDITDYRVFTLPSDTKADKPYRVVIDINKPSPPPDYSFTAGLRGKVIVIDPGHGGSDPGAVGPGGTKEKTVTLAVAKNLRSLLEKAGAKVIMTRQDDRDVYGVNATAVDELKARTTVGSLNKADIFLSIHADSFTSPAARGTSTFYYRKSMFDALLAQSIQTSIVKAGGLTDRSISSANFYVVKRSAMPAALVEMAFISNPDEEKLLNTPQFQQNMAQGIYEGLDNFFAQAARYGGGR